MLKLGPDSNFEIAKLLIFELKLLIEHALINISQHDPEIYFILSFNVYYLPTIHKMTSETYDSKKAMVDALRDEAIHDRRSVKNGPKNDNRHFSLVCKSSDCLFNVRDGPYDDRMLF